MSEIKSEPKSDIKNVNVQLNSSKPREKKIIEMLEAFKKDGISSKEAFMSALENDTPSRIKKLEEAILELKQIMLLGRVLTPQQKVEVKEKAKQELEKIGVVDEEITKADIGGF